MSKETNDTTQLEREAYKTILIWKDLVKEALTSKNALHLRIRAKQLSNAIEYYDDTFKHAPYSS